MEMGFKTKCYPTREQANILSQWIGVQRFVKNSKIREWDYFQSLARLQGCRAVPDQQFSQFHGEGTEFLKLVPSQILRNGAYLWMKTLQKAFKGECGFPKIRKKWKKESVLVTNELFEFIDKNGYIELHLGTKKFPVGVIPFKKHKNFQIPKSIVITKEKSGSWSLSFCFVSEGIADAKFDMALVESLDLEKIVKGFDRGVVIPVAGDDKNYEFTGKEKKRLIELDVKKRRYSRMMSRRTKGGKNREKAKKKKAKAEQKAANIRHDRAHKISREIVDSDTKVFAFEKLNLKNMTASAKGTAEKPGKNVRQKAGLNKAILGSVLGKIRLFVEYKAKKCHKYVMYVNPKYTSQECALCGHIHPDNRKNQSDFECLSCGNVDNADRNAAKVIAKRARKRLLDLGMGLTLVATLEVIASEDARKTSRGQKKSTSKRSSKSSADHVSEEGKTKISSNLLDLGNLGL